MSYLTLSERQRNGKEQHIRRQPLLLLIQGSSSVPMVGFWVWFVFFFFSFFKSAAQCCCSCCLCCCQHQQAKLQSSLLFLGWITLGSVGWDLHLLQNTTHCMAMSSRDPYAFLTVVFNTVNNQHFLLMSKAHQTVACLRVQKATVFFQVVCFSSLSCRYPSFY